MRSFVRSVFLPPALSETVSQSQWRTSAIVRFWMVLSAIGIDLGLWLGLRGNPLIDQDVLRWFAVVNVSLLAIDAAITAASIRIARLRRTAVVLVLTVVEAFTVIVWVQATGTLSSYFALIGPLLQVWYRLYFGYAIGAACVLSLVVFHFGAIALELTGALRPEALFVADPSIVYELPAYQVMAMCSIGFSYVMMFIGGNLVFNKLKERELALAEVRQEMARVAEEVRHGRLTGSVLADDYALGELIGRGGMGEIYAARQLSAERTVAVKVLHGHLIHDDEILERFRREAQVAERVPGRFRAQILAVGVDDINRLHYIAMELLRGEDFAAYLRRRGPLAPSDLIPLLRRVAEALDAAHAAGVVHRDLKPQNIFLVEQADTGDTGGASEIRLLDFGMSKLVDAAHDSLTKADAMIGTVAYMAPEQAMGRASEVGAASDRFAFAATIYRALTGRLPFQAPDLLTAVRLLATAHPPPPSSLQPALHRDVDAVLVIGLAKQPANRYPSATAMVDDLEAASRGALDPARRERASAMWSDIAEGATVTAGTAG